MKNKGFSLVELIVVIAIMAILVGVAVPVYTSYIGKAKKNADIQLTDEIKHALQVEFITARPEVNGDVIVELSTTEAIVIGSGSTTDKQFIKDALAKFFGDNWEDELVLKYDGWETAPSQDNQALEDFNASAYKDAAILRRSSGKSTKSLFRLKLILSMRT